MEKPDSIQTVFQDDYHTQLLQIGLTAIVCNHCGKGAMLGTEILHKLECPEYGQRVKTIQ